MPGFAIDGLSSGLDTKSIIDQVMESADVFHLNKENNTEIK